MGLHAGGQQGRGRMHQVQAHRLHPLLVKVQVPMRGGDKETTLAVSRNFFSIKEQTLFKDVRNN